MRHGGEQLSVDMFWLALAATAVASLLYWGYAFGLWLWVSALDSVRTLI